MKVSSLSIMFCCNIAYFYVNSYIISYSQLLWHFPTTHCNICWHSLFVHLVMFGLNYGHFEGLLLVQKVWSGIQCALEYIVVRLVGLAMPMGTIVQSTFSYRMLQ